MNGRDSAPRLGTMPRVVGVCLTAAAVTLVPTLAMAADAAQAGNTIRGTIGADGTVSSVKQYSADGAASAFDGKMPVTMKISHTASGAAQTYTYHVENTFSQTQTVHYDDTAGNPHHTSIQLQLPLVAQLGVDVPSSLKGVSAPGATVTSDADGTRHLLWNMVLFTPLGTSSQDVTFTASGNGSPVAALRATAVDPNTTPGLSATSQAATARFQQDDFWAGYAHGGNGGLDQLSDGMSSMIDGLVQLYAGAKQLHDGMGAAVDGAKQLDDGTAQAYDGSKDLHKGLGKIHTGTGALSDGVGKIHKGQGDLTDGLTQIHDGQSQLTGGLTLISGGLGQLASPTAGLPAAVAGVQALKAGVEKVLAGIGPTNSATTPGLLDAMALIKGGVQSAAGSLGAIASGLTCASNTIEAAVVGQAAGVKPAGCADAIPVPLAGIADPFTQAVLVGTPAMPGVALQLAGAVTQINASLGSGPGTIGALLAGIDAVTCGLSDTASCPPNTPGVKEGLQQIDAGLTQLQTGVTAASTGVTALSGGAQQALAGSQQLTAGSEQALEGSKKLFAGSGDAAAGAKQLYNGTGKAFIGSGDLTDGLKKLSDGQHQVAAGLPAAVDGSGQIADGLGQVLDGAHQVKDGLGQVQTGATGPLEKQLKADSANGHKQLAVLTSAASLASSGPGGAGTTYVLSQTDEGFALAADTSSDGGSHTGRNVGIGVGGFLLLLVGLGSGFALGRQRRTTTVA